MNPIGWMTCLLALANAAVAVAPSPSVAKKRQETYRIFAEAYISSYYDFHPHWGSWAGRHEYDGDVLPRSAGDISEWIEFNHSIGAQFRSNSSSQLSPDEAIGLALIRSTIAQQLIEFEDMKVYRRNPSTYDVNWGLLNLISRNYAPLDTRIQAAIRQLEGVPKVFEQARANLDAVIPKVVCEVAISNFEGGIEFIRQDVVDAFSEVSNKENQQKLRAAADRAARAVQDFVNYLKKEKLPKANDSFAVGSKVLSRMLRETEAVTISLSELKTIGQADLDRNLDRARAIVDRHFKGKSVADVMKMMEASAYTAQTLIPSVADELESIRQFCVKKDLITIPGNTRPTVTETPKFSRWATAMMDTPGPFETVATEAYYYVTPVDPKWSADEQEQWLAGFNKYVAANISVHEAYPGHFVQFLHSNNAPTNPQKVFFSYAATEGWAHYAEQMMIEAGFGAADPFYELAQIQDALLRNCRLVCAIGLHTEGMSVKKATEFFMKNAFMGEHPARREAERGTFDPGYLNYTLGKLQILKLREDYKKKQGKAYSLKKFHDEFLAHGMPPISYTRTRMLGVRSGSAF